MGLKHLRNYSILHAHGFRDDLRKRNYVLGDPDSTTAQITIWRVAVIEIIEHSRTACRRQKSALRARVGVLLFGQQSCLHGGRIRVDVLLPRQPQNLVHDFVGNRAQEKTVLGYVLVA